MVLLLAASLAALAAYNFSHRRAHGAADGAGDKRRAVCQRIIVCRGIGRAAARLAARRGCDRRRLCRIVRRDAGGGGGIGFAARGERRPTRPSRLPHRQLWGKLVPFAAWLWTVNLLYNLVGVVDRYMMMHFAPTNDRSGAGWPLSQLAGRADADGLDVRADRRDHHAAPEPRLGGGADVRRER